MKLPLELIALVTLCIIALSSAQNPNYSVEKINERSKLGEGPMWDEKQQLLYWADMKNMWIISYNPVTDKLYKATLETDLKPVSLVNRILDTDDVFIIGLKGALALVKWDGQSDATVRPIKIMDVEDPESNTRCNDGKADPENRLWVGTMGEQTKSDPNGNEFEKDKGAIYRIDFDGSKHKMDENLQISNGLEWSLDNTTFYLVDSLTFIVYEYKYDKDKGTIEKKGDLYNLENDGLVGKGKPNTLPDGMTMDSKGMLWVAVYGTGKVIRIDPESRRKVFEIELDEVLQPTSVCFGGKDLEILFITSARVDWTDDFEEKYPQSGYTFKVTNLGVNGAEASRPVKLKKSIVQKCFESTVTKNS